MCDSDGDWQFLCGGDHEDTVTDSALMRCLGCMVAGDLTLNDIAGLGCILEGEHFFVRCVLDIPLIGSGGRSFGYGVWSTPSRKNFLLYQETFDSGEQGDLGPWFGWFSNRLEGYPDSLNLKCQVHPRAGRQRPWVELEATDHPLALEQRNGISFDRLVEILELHGHGLDRALLN
jgi:hypothetical protein